jgi:subfamily B ATP-binding cassette protein MsbA
MTESNGEITRHQKLAALARAARYRPKFAVVLVLLGGATAGLEGIGLGFIYPILEVAQSDGMVNNPSGILGMFVDVYAVLGIPFTLEFLIIGVAGAMTLRFTLSFVVGWLQEVLRRTYEQALKRRAFSSALAAEISYFDKEGSDDILNAIITETQNSARTISTGVEVLKTLSLAGVYFTVMLYIAPRMTVYAIGLLGGITYIIRNIVEPAYTVGDRVATANEELQQSVQAGTQGIRDIKLFGLAAETFETFAETLETKTRAEINLSRNQIAIQNFYDLAAALTLFSLIYIGFIYSGLALGALSIFLLAMFRLSPLISRLNSRLYELEGMLSHLIRTQAFMNKLQGREETGGSKSVSIVSRIEFDSVSFAYDPGEPILNNLSFEVSKGEFVAFVGQSGAGKSTVVSLIARLYEPNSGEIRANGVPISEYDLNSWRDRIAVVRQQPFIFNDTLRNNLTVANREATQSEIEHVCEIAQVDEFLDELPNGYDSQLGDDGVRLSGGQRQRVALARALLKDADFLLLDEATSDLDSNLEQKVQAAIETMDREYAIVAIAHRLSTVKNADRIYTVDSGQIIEQGNHEELLDDDGGYAEMYAIQSKG